MSFSFRNSSWSRPGKQKMRTNYAKKTNLFLSSEWPCPDRVPSPKGYTPWHYTCISRLWPSLTSVEDKLPDPQIFWVPKTERASVHLDRGVVSKFPSAKTSILLSQNRPCQVCCIKTFMSGHLSHSYWPEDGLCCILESCLELFPNFNTLKEHLKGHTRSRDKQEWTLLLYESTDSSSVWSWLSINQVMDPLNLRETRSYLSGAGSPLIMWWIPKISGRRSY